MAVKMRLRREGKRKQPFYRVVVADSRSPRDGRFIEDIGFYQPLSDPSTIAIDHDRALYWLRNGVQPSDAVKQLLRVQGIWEEYKPGDPGKQRPARAEAEARARASAQTSGSEPSAAPAAEPEAAPAETAPAETAPAAGTGATEAGTDETAQAETAEPEAAAASTDADEPADEEEQA
ncbi:MAG: 30S ribosomal protein S16 [Egibacteraceae bacterium]